MGLRASYPELVQRVTLPVGRVLARTPLRPNHLTTLGVVLSAAAATLVAVGHPVRGGVVLIAGGAMDALDGSLARARGTSTAFGAFFDSVSDRVSDGLVLIGLAWWLRDGRDDMFLLALVALLAAQLTSYVRARAEAIDLDCSVGMLERTERAVLLVVGLLFHRVLLGPVLWVLAVGGVVTVLQRSHHVWCQIERDVPPELLGLTQGDRVWNQAYRAAARRVFGPSAFDGVAAAQEQVTREGTTGGG